MPLAVSVPTCRLWTSPPGERAEGAKGAPREAAALLSASCVTLAAFCSWPVAVACVLCPACRQRRWGWGADASRRAWARPILSLLCVDRTSVARHLLARQPVRHGPTAPCERARRSSPPLSAGLLRGVRGHERCLLPWALPPQIGGLGPEKPQRGETGGGERERAPGTRGMSKPRKFLVHAG